MVAAYRDRSNPRLGDGREILLDILVAFGEAEAAAEGNVADVGNLNPRRWRYLQRVMIGADALDLTHGARAEP